MRGGRGDDRRRVGVAGLRTIYVYRTVYVLRHVFLLWGVGGCDRWLSARALDFKRL